MKLRTISLAHKTLPKITTKFTTKFKIKLKTKFITRFKTRFKTRFTIKSTTKCTTKFQNFKHARDGKSMAKLCEKECTYLHCKEAAEKPNFGLSTENPIPCTSANHHLFPFSLTQKLKNSKTSPSQLSVKVATKLRKNFTFTFKVGCKIMNKAQKKLHLHL
ncbi:hypothetical protein M758_UG088800 [Ceratodon purpureus]|nr:hypothetical protein M758_UG088800 [Ceratodon purpureus]